MLRGEERQPGARSSVKENVEKVVDFWSVQRLLLCRRCYNIRRK